MVYAGPKPDEARLKVQMTQKGVLRLLYDDEPMAGVMSIKCAQDAPRGIRSVVTVEFIGLAVCLETEPCKQAN